MCVRERDISARIPKCTYECTRARKAVKIAFAHAISSTTPVSHASERKRERERKKERVCDSEQRTSEGVCA